MSELPPSKAKTARQREKRHDRRQITHGDVGNVLEGLNSTVPPVTEPPAIERAVPSVEPAHYDWEAPAVPEPAPDVTGDITSIAYNNQRLRELGDFKKKLNDKLIVLETADKEEIALIKAKLSVLESQEKDCRENLKLFNKKNLEAAGGVDLIRIEIVDYTGDTFRTAGMLGAK